MSASSFKIRGAAWKDFKIARLQISVGQHYHEGVMLEDALSWAAANFERVIVCVNDTLQRHNLQFAGLSAKDAFNQAENAGREWIERNMKALQLVPDDKRRIVRWESWRRRPEYPEKLRQVESLYAADRQFQRLLHDNIEDFWMRQKRNGLADDDRYADFKAMSLKYLIEETAAFFVMFARDRAVDIYPGSSLLPCAHARPEINRRGFVRLDFRNGHSINSHRSVDMDTQAQARFG